MMRVLIAVTSCERQGNNGRFTGYELPGVSHAYLIFRDLGYEVDFVSPAGGNPPIERYTLSDPISRAFLEDEDAQFRIRNSRRPEQVQPQDYCALLLAGGQGALWDFADNQALQQLAREIYSTGGAIGAIAEGMSGLINLDLADGRWLVAGKRIHSLSHPDDIAGPIRNEGMAMEACLQERGAVLRRTLSLQGQIVVSGRLVTTQDPEAAEAVARALVGIAKKAGQQTRHHLPKAG